MALVTGSLNSEAAKILKKLNLTTRFNVTITAQDVFHGKANTEGYLLAAQCLGLPPSQCVAIEDLPSGIKVAKQAGIHRLALTTTRGAAELQLADRIEPTMPPNFRLN